LPPFGVSSPSKKELLVKKKIQLPTISSFNSPFKGDFSVIEKLWRENNSIYSCYHISEEEIIENWLGNWFQPYSNYIYCLKEVDEPSYYYNKKYNPITITLENAYPKQGSKGLYNIYATINSIDDVSITMHKYNLTEVEYPPIIQSLVDWVDKLWIVSKDEFFEGGRRLEFNYFDVN